jgi:flagellar L-ring protein precursor FlgH
MKELITLCALALVLSGCASNVPKRMEQSSYAPAMPVDAPRTSISNGSLYQSGGLVAFFNDDKAHKVGDIIYITLSEKTDATKSSSSALAKSSDNTVGLPTLFGKNPSLKALGINDFSLSTNSNHNFSGQGDAAQSNSLTGQIAVTVTEVLNNGNLMVRGEKWMTINQGEEVVRLSGIVRSSDIDANNTVASTKVADARIIYSGDGMVHDATTQPWLARFFSAIWPF